MALSISLISLIVLLIILATAPKTMHLFELIFSAMTVVYFYTYKFSIFTNMQLVSVSMDKQEALASIIIRMALNPVITVLFLQIYLTLRSYPAKFSLTFACTLLLALLEYVSNLAGLIKQTEAAALWSVFTWFIILMLCILAMRWFRILVGKELNLP